VNQSDEMEESRTYQRLRMFGTLFRSLQDDEWRHILMFSEFGVVYGQRFHLLFVVNSKDNAEQILCLD